MGSDGCLPNRVKLTGNRVFITHPRTGERIEIYEQLRQSFPGTEAGKKKGWIPEYRFEPFIYRYTTYKYEGDENINIPDMLKGESKMRWTNEFENGAVKSVVGMDVIVSEIQAHFAKCYAERALLYMQEVPLLNISGLQSDIPEAQAMGSVAV